MVSPDWAYALGVLEVGEVLDGKYRITGVLGRGAMGIVHSAEHVMTQRELAVKFVAASSSDEEYAQRLLREARNAGRIQHENVVDVFDFGHHPRGVYLIMERLLGNPLSKAMAGKPMEMGRALRLVLDVCAGVSAAHRRGVLHRDLKPDNIFLCTDPDGNDPKVKVLDFGISKRVDPTKALTITKTGLVMGTPLYMSPEQMQGAKDLDVRCDVYAIACVLYTMLEGVAPFDPTSLQALKIGKLGDRVRPFQYDLPDPVRDTIMRSLSSRRGKRPKDVDTFAAALEPYADPAEDVERSGVFLPPPGMFEGDGHPTEATTLKQTAWGQPIVAMVGLLLLAALATAAWFILQAR